MKLFHKIFVCFLVIFGVAFLAAGFLLLNFAYRNAISQEKKYAMSEFQHNKFVLQSILYSNPDYLTDASKNFTMPVTVFGGNGEYLLSTIDNPPELNGSDNEADNKILYRIIKEGNDCSIYIKDTFVIDGESFGLLTKTDITTVVEDQKILRSYFQKIYIIILCIEFPVIFFLSYVLTASIKKVRKSARKIAGGRYSERIDVKGHDEIAELAKDFNHMADSIEEKIDELSKTAREKEEFAANFAHEMKTPLTSVIGYADMLYQKDLTRNQVKSAAKYIWDEGMRLEALSHKMMDLFVLDKQKFLFEELELKPLINSVLTSVESIVSAKNITCHVNLEAEYIYADCDLIITMLVNVIDNAAKAECKNIWINAKENDDGLIITIIDDGKGIPVEELKRVKEAFYMVDKSRSRKQHGAGLGMALIDKIAQVHNARFIIDSDGETHTIVSFMFERWEADSDV